MEAAEYHTMAAVEERHWWYRGLHDLVLRYVQSEADRQKGPLRILDAGCGTGGLAQLLGSYGEVSACDTHPLAVAATRARGVANVFATDLTAPEPGLGEGRYDIITCLDVIYHRQVHDDAMAVRNLYRALKPGGLLLVQVAAFEALRGEHDLRVHTRHRYVQSELGALVLEAGLHVQHVSYRLLPLFLPLWCWRRLRQQSPVKVVAASDVEQVPPRAINDLLHAYVLAENWLVVSGLQLPFGTSLFIAARKLPGESAGA